MICYILSDIMERPRAWDIKREGLSPEERDRMVVLGRLQMQLASPIIDARGRYRTKTGLVLSQVDINLWMSVSKKDHDQIHSQAYDTVEESSNGNSRIEDGKVFEEELKLIRLMGLQ